MKNIFYILRLLHITYICNVFYIRLSIALTNSVPQN